jgi:peptide deformylase
MSLPIVHYNSPVLRQKGAAVDPADPALPRLVEDMLDTMRAAKGIGLAAQQVGQARQLCVVEVPEEMDVDGEGQRLNPDLAMPMVVLNPEILSASRETWVYEEGCLSFPEVHGKVTRPFGIRLRYQDAGGVVREVEARGLVARCLQHEIDHLNGVLFIDRMSAAKKVALAPRLRRLAAETRSADAG